MPSIIRKIGFVAQRFGLDPRQFGAAASSVVPFVRSYAQARKLDSREWPIEFLPALGDRAETAGAAKGHYFHMDLWAARHVYAGRFRKVVDVGSRIDGYVAHVLSFRDIEVFDVRPLKSEVAGMTFTCADMMDPPSLAADYADCISCLHALEHFGLGRYGDPVDLDGWKKGLAGLAQMLASGGTLLLAVPVGRQRIEFDAHRVFHPETIIAEADKLGLSLIDFSAVDDEGRYRTAPDMTDAKQMAYGCGCFLLRKR